ncbi:MAG: hypothetical protein FWD36_09795 [Treponema sp.]|nr:hypothetical protein [Treponema sp.]
MATTVNERPEGKAPPTGEGLTFEKVWAMFQEIAERQQETDRQMKENRNQMKETDRKIGELSNRFGELAEHLVAPGIADRFNELGHHFYGVAPGGYEIRDDQKKVIAQIDILLENGDCIMAVEVKAKPRKQDIDHHIKRLEILRKYRNKKYDNRTIYGAIAGAIFGGEEKEAAIAAGFYVLEQTGDTMKMDIPDNFVPREW